MLVSYNWLQTFFDEKLPSPDELAEKLTFGAFEIEGIEKKGGDTVIDIDVLPNRSSDCLSHRGIAREVSVLTGISLTHDFLSNQVALNPKTDEISVRADDAKRCPYYAAAFIRGIKVSPSPKWLSEKLEAIGQKSINNIVDATNYVMFELGTPLHAFDADKLGETIGVRAAESGEKITILGGEEMELTDEMTVITDADANVPIAIAGVKGGEYAELSEGTTNIVLEAAKFDPVLTRKTSQMLKLRTDASSRFENEVPDELPAYGLARVVEIILDVAGGDLVGYAASDNTKKETHIVDVSVEHINRLLGTGLSSDDVHNMLDKLAFEHSEDDADTINVTIPFERLDLRIAEDLIEEIGRVYGYGNIEAKELPEVSDGAIINKKRFVAEKIRRALSEAGFTEVLTYSLRDSGKVALANALASDKDHLRENLSSGVREALDRNEKNAPLLGVYGAVRVFEIGNVFPASEKEEVHVCIGVRPIAKKKREAKEKEEITAAVGALKDTFGVDVDVDMGDANMGVLEFNLETLAEKISSDEKYPSVPVVDAGVQYSQSSVYPFVLRDVAVWVSSSAKATEDKPSADDVKKIIEDNAGGLLVRSDLFDEFEKDGRKSYAFHLVFQSHEKTLSDEEVGAVMEGVETALKERSWEVR